MSKESMKMNRRDFLGLGAVAAVGAMAWQDARPRLRPRKTSEQLVAQPRRPKPQRSRKTGLAQSPKSPRATSSKPSTPTSSSLAPARPALPAAGAAADLGLNFIACDKSNQVPETREYLGGVDTAYAKANNVTIDRPKLLNELTRYASGKCNQKLIKRWIDDSAEYIDWVTEVMKDAGKEVMLDMPPEHATGGTRLLCALCAAPVGALLRPAHAQRRHRRALVRPRSRHSVRA